jgi:TonB family protein
MSEGKSSTRIYVVLAAAIIGGCGIIGTVVYFAHKNGTDGSSPQPMPGLGASFGSVDVAKPVTVEPEESADDMRRANDEAVKLIEANKIDDAIGILEPLLRHHPRYVRARENLCTAYNNKVVSDTKNNTAGLDLLRRAVSLDSDNADARKNLNILIKCSGRDPLKFEDRVYLGDQQAKANCLYGAYVEYTAALAIHNDVMIVGKRKNIMEKMALSDNNDPNGAFYIRMARREEAGENAVGDNNVDFAAYLASLQNTVRDHWTPPDTEAEEKIDVSFTIAVDGTLSNVAVVDSSGDKAAEKSAIQAVEATGKAEPLPLKASVPIEITLHFEQGRSDSGVIRKIVH